MGQPSPYFDRTWADVVPTKLHVAIQHSSNINTAPTWSHDSCWQMQWSPRAPRFDPKRRSRPVASAPRIAKTTCSVSFVPDFAKGNPPKLHKTLLFAKTPSHLPSRLLQDPAAVVPDHCHLLCPCHRPCPSQNGLCHHPGHLAVTGGDGSKPLEYQPPRFALKQTAMSMLCNSYIM